MLSGEDFARLYEKLVLHRPIAEAEVTALADSFRDLTNAIGEAHTDIVYRGRDPREVIDRLYRLLPEPYLDI